MVLSDGTETGAQCFVYDEFLFVGGNRGAAGTGVRAESGGAANERSVQWLFGGIENVFAGTGDL